MMKRKVSMRLFCTLLAVMLLCIMLLFCFSSCSQGATCTIKEIDGKYYLNFADGNEPQGEESISSISQKIDFESIADMKQAFSGKEEIEFHTKGALRCFFPKTEGKGIHFFNMERLLVPVLPQGFSEQPSQVYMRSDHRFGAFYALRHTLTNNENVTAEVAFYHSMKDWNLHMEDTLTNYLALLGDNKQTSYEREGNTNRITIDDGSSRLQYHICTDEDSKRYVIEFLREDHRSVTMFVLEGETFFSVRMSGLTESPSLEYLQSFSAKVYED